MLEGLTTLGFMAAHTTRARLGLMVGGVHYRAPGLWVKATTTLDVLSGGRAWLGIGAAWNEEESRGLGFPFPPLGERFELLEETLQIGHAMFDRRARHRGELHGRHTQAERLLNSPQALSRPRVPIMVGGGGEKKTLRLVAKYADASNVFGSPEAIARKYAILAEHCAAIGRDPRRDRALDAPERRSRPAGRGGPRRRRRSSTGSASWAMPAPSTSSSACRTLTISTPRAGRARDDPGVAGAVDACHGTSAAYSPGVSNALVE